MRFELRTTSDGSLTVFDADAGECFKSQHSAALETNAVFIHPGIRENPWLGEAKPFRVLELGFGLGTNFLSLRQSELAVDFTSIERDLAGARFSLEHFPAPELAEFVRQRTFERKSFRAQLMEVDFFVALEQLARAGARFHAIFFDPFSPKANPEAWTEKLFRGVAALMEPNARLVTYSVSRIAKDAAEAAGLVVEKHKLPPTLQKRSALLATKPAR